MIALDMQGNRFALGDRIVRVAGINCTLVICKVTKISAEGRIYADNCDVPVMFPHRCLIVTSLVT